jgi:hypothetical protein
MNELNILLGQSFTHMVGSEAQAKQVVESYKREYTIKKSTIDKKVKKGQEYWKVTVVVDHVVEKDAFEMYFDVE